MPWMLARPVRLDWTRRGCDSVSRVLAATLDDIGDIREVTAMPMLLVMLGLSLATGVIRMLMRGVASCLALLAHPLRLVVFLANSVFTAFAMLSGLLMLAFLLMHFLAGSDAPALDGSFALIVAAFLTAVLASMLMDWCDARLRRRSARHG